MAYFSYLGQPTFVVPVSSTADTEKVQTVAEEVISLVKTPFVFFGCFEDSTKI